MPAFSCEMKRKFNGFEMMKNCGFHLLLLCVCCSLDLKSNLALPPSSFFYSLFFRKEPEAKNWARTASTAGFQSQLSWGFLINECLPLPEFSILFDFSEKYQHESKKGANLLLARAGQVPSKLKRHLATTL